MELYGEMIRKSDCLVSVMRFCQVASAQLLQRSRRAAPARLRSPSPFVSSDRSCVACTSFRRTGVRLVLCGIGHDLPSSVGAVRECVTAASQRDRSALRALLTQRHDMEARFNASDNYSGMATYPRADSEHSAYDGHTLSESGAGYGGAYSYEPEVDDGGVSVGSGGASALSAVAVESDGFALTLTLKAAAALRNLSTDERKADGVRL
eukprot:4279542-Pleurochrysis_carterae.AAC.1